MGPEIKTYGLATYTSCMLWLISVCMSIARSICVPLHVPCGWEWVGVAVLEVFLGTSYCEKTCILSCVTVGPTLRTGIRSYAMGWSMHLTPNCRWGCAPFPFLSSPLPAPLSFREGWSRVLSSFCLSILKSSFPRKSDLYVYRMSVAIVYLTQAGFFGGLGNGRSLSCWLQPLDKLTY